jgi:hypothetical protein
MRCLQWTESDSRTIIILVIYINYDWLAGTPPCTLEYQPELQVERRPFLASKAVIFGVN